jgi:hypothetical protein
MRWLLALAALGLLVLGLGACGGSGLSPGSTGAASTPARQDAATVGWTVGAGHGQYRGDQNPLDDDEQSSQHPGVNPPDNDADFDNESVDERIVEPYYDSDDTYVRTFGRVASASLARAVAGVVERYYAAAVAGDGRTGCSMMVASFARGIPSNYAGLAGPTYLRGAKGCSGVMSKVFEHSHSELTGGVAVVAVRAQGDQAIALLGSPAQPARSLALSREGGAWKISGLLPVAPP